MAGVANRRSLSRQRGISQAQPNPLRCNALYIAYCQVLTLFSMYASQSKQSQRPRELRRRVMLPARLRTGAQWSDTCILNLSSRGLMIHSGRGVQEGSTIELRRGDHVIIARVMWRDGGRVGLQSDERLPVELIMSLGQSQALQLTASSATVDRREEPRPAADARLHGRAMEFVSVGVIAASMALAIWSMASVALARPMAAVAIALG